MARSEKQEEIREEGMERIKRGRKEVEDEVTEDGWTLQGF